MSEFIENFYYGSIEPQALSSGLSVELNKKLNTLTEKGNLHFFDSVFCNISCIVKTKSI